jgi:type I restriction enzyme M protein
MNTTDIVQRLWNCCNVLYDGGMGCGDHVKRLTHLLFFKMAAERARAAHKPKGWQ